MRYGHVLGLAGEYFDRKVTLFTLKSVIVATIEAFYQLRLRHHVTGATLKLPLWLERRPMKARQGEKGSVRQDTFGGYPTLFP
jgi:hypothetical protein